MALTSEQTRALEQLRNAHKAVLDAEKAEVQAVAEARRVGVTWDLIADAVGMLQPNAHRKFSKLIDEQVTRTVTVRSDQTSRRRRRS